MNLTVTLPTKGKPAELKQMWQTALDTADNPEIISLSLCINQGDTESEQAIYELQNQYQNTISYVATKFRGLAYAVEQATEAIDSDIYMFVADDVRFSSQGWDTAVLAAFDKHPDRLALGSTSDNHHDNDGFSAHFSLSRQVKEVLGYYTPKFFSQNYLDTWWNEIFTNIGRYENTGMRLQHLHDAEDQAKHQRLASGYNFAYWYNTVDERRQDAIKLLDAIEPGTDHSDFKYDRIHFI